MAKRGNQRGTDLLDFGDFQKHAKNPVLRALKCTNRGHHGFPSDPGKNWQIVIRRNKWVPRKSSVVCYYHFTVTGKRSHLHR